MTQEKATQLKRFLINTSIGPSAVRNQGVGIINAIRDKLSELVSFEKFFKHLFSKDDIDFRIYLDTLTEEVKDIPGIDKNKNLTGDNVKWGTARKCINLLFRSVVYGGHIWEDYKINDSIFSINSKMQRLELPLDSNVVGGLKKRLDKINHPEYNAQVFRNFTITHLTPEISSVLQKQADALSIYLNICKIDLDLILWRPEEEL